MAAEKYLLRYARRGILHCCPSFFVEFVASVVWVVKLRDRAHTVVLGSNLAHAVLSFTGLPICETSKAFDVSTTLRRELTSGRES